MVILQIKKTEAFIGLVMEVTELYWRTNLPPAFSHGWRSGGQAGSACYLSFPWMERRS